MWLHKDIRPRQPAGSACWLCTGHGAESAQREGHHFLIILKVLSPHPAALPQSCTESDKRPFSHSAKALPGLAMFLSLGVSDTVHLEGDPMRW